MFMLVFVFLVSGFSLCAEDNLVKNPDFNNKDKNNFPVDWDSQNNKCVSIGEDEGNSYVEIKSADSAPVFLVQRGLKLIPEKKYLVSYRIKGDGKASAMVYVEWVGKGHTGANPNLKAVNSNSWQTVGGKWETRKFDFVCPDKEYSSPYIVICLKGPGEICVDDIKITEMPNAQNVAKNGNNLLTCDKGNGGTILLQPAGKGLPRVWKRLCETGKEVAAGGNGLVTESAGPHDAETAPGWAVEIPTAEMTGLGCMFIRVTARVRTEPAGQPFAVALAGIYTQAGGDKIEIPVDAKSPVEKGQAAWTEQSWVFHVTDNAPTRFELQLRFLGQGKAWFDEIKIAPKAKVANADETGLSTQEWYVRRRNDVYAPPSKGSDHNANVRLRGDQVLLVNGQPRFPLWVMGGKWNITETFLNKITSFGCNGFVPQCEDFDILFDRCHELGLMVMIWNNFGDEAADETAICAKIKRMRAAAEGRDNVIGWLLDEPKWRGIPGKQVESCFRLFCQQEKERLFWVNEAPRGTESSLQQYLWNAADITGCDIYPVWGVGGHSGLQNKTPSSVGEYTQIMRRAVLDSKPTIMIIQAGEWDRPLTSEAVRFMSYDAVINGARGLCYYTDYGMKNLDQGWALTGAVTQELRALEGVLTAPRAIGEIRQLEGTIEILRLNDGADDYWLCANTAPTEAVLTTACLGKATPIKVLFEGARVVSSSEPFAPYAVHVYTTRSEPLALWSAPPASTAKEAVKALSVDKLQKGILGFEGWQANWIWMKDKTWNPDMTKAKCDFLPMSLYARKTFTLAKAPDTAWLVATFDDRLVELYINGRRIDINAVWKIWQIAGALDITSLLKPGKNSLAIKVFNGDTYGGFLCEVGGTIGQTGFSVVSDTSWKLNLQGPPEWEMTEFDDSSWQNAVALGRPPAFPWYNISISGIKPAEAGK